MTPGTAKHEVPMVSHGSMQPGEFEKAIGRVLVADEDYAVRRTLHTSLFEAGFDITEAYGLDEASALAQVVRCDLALLAAHLTGRKPAEICRQMRAYCPGLPILMLTSGNDERDQLEALGIPGADDCIAKPLRMSEVMARLRAVMRRTHSLRVPSQPTIRIGEIEVNPSPESGLQSQAPPYASPRKSLTCSFI